MSWRDEMYTANEKALQAEVRRLRNVVRDLEDQIDQLRKKIRLGFLLVQVIFQKMKKRYW